MEGKDITGEGRGAIKAEGPRGGGNRPSWPGLLPLYPNSQSEGEAETESNPSRRRKKRQDGGTILDECMNAMGKLYKEESKLIRDLARRH